MDKNRQAEHSINITRKPFTARNIWSGFIFGIGIVAFIDEAVFHQILHWHKFYDQATTEIGLISDGLFHAFSWFATVGGLFLFADLRKKNALWPKRWVGGILLGAGAFQLYDGTIHHKVMRVHQIRYNVNIVPYDLIWNGIAIALILIGVTLIWSTSKVLRNKVKGNATHDH